jgi:predicted RNA-binding Zn-ribbon protein involved in translation (DUF1610 family)
MPERVPSCSTCNVTMEIGYTVIANYQIAPHTALRSLKWVAGEPLLFRSEAPLLTRTYRCPSCGYLASYTRAPTP